MDTERLIEVKKIKKPKRRVFSHLVNKTAIVDKIVLSVDGELNETFREEELVNVNPKSIFHPGGLYAGCIFAVWSLTGNPVSIHHGKMANFANVPPLRFTMQSENIPLTAAQVQLLARRCTCKLPK
jgi:hypothetical protein